jgi:hypothetical protein
MLSITPAMAREIKETAMSDKSPLTQIYSLIEMYHARLATLADLAAAAADNPRAVAEARTWQATHDIPDEIRQYVLKAAE